MHYCSVNPTPRPWFASRSGGCQPPRGGGPHTYTSLYSSAPGTINSKGGGFFLGIFYGFLKTPKKNLDPTLNTGNKSDDPNSQFPRRGTGDVFPCFIPSPNKQTHACMCVSKYVHKYKPLGVSHVSTHNVSINNVYSVAIVVIVISYLIMIIMYCVYQLLICIDSI